MSKKMLLVQKLTRGARAALGRMLGERWAAAFYVSEQKFRRIVRAIMVAVAQQAGVAPDKIASLADDAEGALWFLIACGTVRTGGYYSQNPSLIAADLIAADLIERTRWCHQVGGGFGQRLALEDVFRQVDEAVDELDVLAQSIGEAQLALGPGKPSALAQARALQATLEQLLGGPPTGRAQRARRPLP